MAVNQVVLFFDQQQDAVLFAVAASAVMSSDRALNSSKAAANVAMEISKASRITTAGALNVS